MKLIDAVMAHIREHRHSKSSDLLAEALMSACSKRHGPSLLEVSANLDERNARLFARLARITEEPDFSNTDQSTAFWALKDMGYFNTFFDIEVDGGRRIQVYGTASVNLYEWRLVGRDDQIEHDTQDENYADPTKALRDALVKVYGVPFQVQLEHTLDKIDACGAALRGTAPESA